MVVVSFGFGRRGGSVLNVVGSTSVQPFAELLSQEYQKVHPTRAVDVQGGGSTQGVQSVLEDIADIGMCSRKLKAEEAQKLQAIQIAQDGLAVVVHTSNPIHGLRLTEIRDIFAGRLTQWDDLPQWAQAGGRPKQPIRLITREEGSGTREAFTKLVMEARDKSVASGPGGSGEGVGHEPLRISPKALTQESNGAVKELVRHDPCAIGYMSLGLVGQDLKALDVEGVSPTIAEVTRGGYPLVRPFLFVVKGRPGPDAQAFIDYVLSAEGQRLLEAEGLVRIR